MQRSLCISGSTVLIKEIAIRNFKVSRCSAFRVPLYIVCVYIPMHAYLCLYILSVDLLVARKGWCWRNWTLALVSVVAQQRQVSGPLMVSMVTMHAPAVWLHRVRSV